MTTMRTNPPATEATVMQVLATSLTEVGTAVAGEHGDRIRALKDHQGFIANTVRKIVGLLIELLRLLADALKAVENAVRGTDAIFALTEVLLDSADALGTALANATSLQSTGSQRLTSTNDVTTTIFRDVGPLLSKTRQLVPTSTLAEALPAVHQINYAQAELDRLLQTFDPQKLPRASLVALAQQISPQVPSVETAQQALPPSRNQEEDRNDSDRLKR